MKKYLNLVVIAMFVNNIKPCRKNEIKRGNDHSLLRPKVKSELGQTNFAFLGTKMFNNN